MFDFHLSYVFLTAELLSDGDHPQIELLTQDEFMNLPLVLPLRAISKVLTLIQTLHLFIKHKHIFTALRLYSKPWSRS